MTARGTALLAAFVLVVSLPSAWTARPGAAAPSRQLSRSVEAHAAPRPNILLITTDDATRTDLHYLPRTRRLLGAHGVTFDGMLSPHPLCCPARAEILTGQFAQNNGVRSNNPRYHGGYPYFAPARTVATWLDDAGYATAFVGKYLNGYEEVTPGPEPGWDVWNPIIRGIYHYFDYRMWENGSPESHTDVHSSDLISQRTVQYIDQLAPADEPFFIWASHVAPHGECEDSCAGPAVPAQRHEKLFQGEQSPSFTSPAFNERNVSDKPGYIAKLPKVPRARINLLFRSRIRTLQAFDEAVEAAVDTLERHDELDNTLIVYLSDNGYLLGEHRYVRKDVPYEPALRTPVLMRGPGLPVRVTRDQMVSMVDIAPTLVDAAGATATLVMDGRSLLPMAQDGSVPGYDTALIQSGPRTKAQVDDGWNFRGVRTARYTYARFPNTGFVELYDRRRDPAELHNAASDRRYRAVRKELWRRLRELRGCAGMACRRDFGPVPAPR